MKKIPYILIIENNRVVNCIKSRQDQYIREFWDQIVIKWPDHDLSDEDCEAITKKGIYHGNEFTAIQIAWF